MNDDRYIWNGKAYRMKPEYQGHGCYSRTIAEIVLTVAVICALSAACNVAIAFLGL